MSLHSSFTFDAITARSMNAAHLPDEHDNSFVAMRFPLIRHHSSSSSEVVKMNSHRHCQDRWTHHMAVQATESLKNQQMHRPSWDWTSRYSSNLTMSDLHVSSSQVRSIRLACFLTLATLSPSPQRSSSTLCCTLYIMAEMILTCSSSECSIFCCTLYIVELMMLTGLLCEVCWRRNVKLRLRLRCSVLLAENFDILHDCWIPREQTLKLCTYVGLADSKHCRFA